MMIITMMSMRLVMLMRLIRMMEYYRLHAAPKRSSAQSVVMAAGKGGEDHVLSVLDQARLEEGSYY